MKLNPFIAIFLTMICNFSFCQDFKNDPTSVKAIDTLTQTNSNNNTSDRLALKTPANKISKKNKPFFSEKKWTKVKNQLLKNKRRFSRSNNLIHRKLDTIYVDPKITPGSSLSDW